MTMLLEETYVFLKKTVGPGMTAGSSLRTFRHF